MWVAGWLKLNPRQPWLWPAFLQKVCVALAVVVGALIVSPGWLSAWDAWEQAQEDARTLARIQVDLHDAQQRLAQLMQEVTQRQSETPLLTSNRSSELPKLSEALTQLAVRERLALSLVDWSAAVPVSSLKANVAQQVPVHVQLHGTWPAWMRWWTDLPEVVPHATLLRLDLNSQPSGGWRAQVVLHIPQQGALPITQKGSDGPVPGASLQAVSEAIHDDPVDARVWAQTQTQHAQQHPSYARWVVPELRRTRSHLEALPRERLRYVGRISQDGLHQALLRGYEITSAAAYAPIYRVAVGDYVGQDFGRVQMIGTDQLTLRELVPNAQGVWQPREVILPLEDGAK